MVTGSSPVAGSKQSFRFSVAANGAKSQVAHQTVLVSIPWLDVVKLHKVVLADISVAPMKFPFVNGCFAQRKLPFGNKS